MKIVYAGAIGQKDTATFVHVVRNARMLKEMGHTVIFCCEYPVRGETVIGDEFEYIYTDPYSGPSKMRSAQWAIEQIFGYRVTRLLKQTLRKNRPDILILYDPASLLLQSRIRKICKRERIGLVTEVTEWPEYADREGIEKLIYWQRDIRKRYFDVKCGNIIAISPMLEKHYLSQGSNVLRLPPVYQKSDFREKPADVARTPLKLVFAGTLAQKDYLLPMIEAVNRANKSEIKVEFEIIGPSMEDIRKSACTELGSGIHVLGRVTHDEAMRHVEQAHFSVLLREDKQYAKAGVSTKFTEAMCVGTPSICTSVGGTDAYVQDGVNGVLVQNNEIGTLTDAIYKILQMSPEQITAMKWEALKTAKKYFLDENYRSAVAAFLKCVVDFRSSCI